MIGIIITDNRDSSEQVDISYNNTVNRSISGTYTVSYFVTDRVGNVSNTLYRTVVVDDTTRPVITLEGSNPYTIGASQNAYSDLDATVSDIGDPNVTLIRDIEGVNISTTGTYTVIYTATDRAQYSAETKYRTVVVLEDDQPPTISVSNPYTIDATSK